jgi:hypothetical protein
MKAQLGNQRKFAGGTEDLIPYAAPSYQSFWREQPVRGAAGMPHVAEGAGALSATLVESEERRK